MPTAVSTKARSAQAARVAERNTSMVSSDMNGAVLWRRTPIQCFNLLQMQDFRWLQWAQQLQAVAQTGDTYANNEFDRQRYDLVRNIAAAMMAAGSGAEPRELVEVFAREGGYATPKL